MTYVIGGTQSAPKKSQRQPLPKTARRTLALGSSHVYCPNCKTTTPGGSGISPNCVPCANNGTISTLTTPPKKMGAMQRAMMMAPLQSKQANAPPKKMGAMQRAMTMAPLQSKQANAPPKKMGAMQRAMTMAPLQSKQANAPPKKMGAMQRAMTMAPLQSKKTKKNSVQRTAPTIISPVG